MSDEQTTQDDAAEQSSDDAPDFIDFSIASATAAIELLAGKYTNPLKATLTALGLLNAAMLVDKGVIAEEHAEEFMEAFDHIVKLYAERKQKGGS